VLIICYVPIVLVGLVLVVFRKVAILVRGERFFGLTVFFLFGACISTFASGIRPSGSELLFWGAALLTSLLLKDYWFLIREDEAATAAVLENSFAMLLIPYEQHPRGYALHLRDAVVLIEIFPSVPKCSILRFRGAAGQGKIRLLRLLLIKKIQPVFPRLTIDLR